MKIHPQRFKALFSLFSLNLSCFDIACIENLKATMVAPLMIGLLDGRNPRICCLILNFSKGEDKLICLPSPKLGDLIPQKKTINVYCQCKITHVLREKALTYLT